MSYSLEHFELQRFRTRLFSLCLQAALAAAGAVVAYRMPQRATHWEWAVFAFDALLCLALLPVLFHARRTGQRRMMDWIGWALVMCGGAVVLQRIVYAYHGPLLQDFLVISFRPILAFIPFVYVAAQLLMPVRHALRFSWMYGALVTLIVLSGMYAHGTLEPGRADAVLVLAWLLVGNPLFILMMHALPRYEDWLQQARRELSLATERDQLRAGLKDSEERFNLIVESLEVGAWDRRRLPGPERWWSPRLYQMLGLRPGEVEPTLQSLAALVHPDEREGMVRGIREQIARTGSLDLDLRLLTRERGYRWFNARARAHLNDRGETVRWIGAFVDVDQRYQLQEQLREAQSELIELAYLDALTSLHNRRAFDEYFESEWRRSTREETGLTVMALDIDFFKPYNDRYGHARGDEAIRAVATVLNQEIRRPGDFAARLGGEEFAIVLPSTSLDGALRVAQRIRDVIHARRIEHQAAPLGHLTVSIGLAQRHGDHANRQALLKSADEALYAAKAAGRDCTLCAPIPVVTE